LVRQRPLKLTRTANQLPYAIQCLSDDFFHRPFENEKTVDVFGRPVTLGGEISFLHRRES